MANDLLSFVQALDAAQDEGEVLASAATRKRELKPILKSSTKVTLQDLVHADADQDVDQSSKKRKKFKKPLEAPLPLVLRRKVEKEVAWEEARKDVGKWAPIINENRQKENLTYGGFQPLTRSMSNMAKPLDSISEFERSYLDAVSQNKSQEDEGPVALPDNPEAVLKDSVDTIERAKLRADSFFKDKKAAHQSRIKSKKYRRMLAKDREKANLRVELARDPRERFLQENDPEYKQKRKEEALMARAKERLTLKTRKASQWASDMLLHKHSLSNDVVGKEVIMEQVRDKERLRREILGKPQDIDSDEDSEEDMDSVSGSEEDFQEITGDVEEEEEEAIGRRTFSAQSRSVPVDDKVEEVIHEDEEKSSFIKGLLDKVVSKQTISDPNALLFQQSFVTAPQQSEINPEFEKEKQREIEGDAPKTLDVTLPGWGTWTGPSFVNAPKPTTRVVKNVAGTSAEQRKDFKLPHIIITEKRIKAANHYQADRVPYPFASREQYELHLDNPLGPDWNTIGSFRKKTAPKVRVKAGNVIKPLKLSKPKNSANL